MKSYWVPLLMAVSAVVGLGVGHLSGRLSANSYMLSVLDSIDIYSHGLPRSKSKLLNVLNIVNDNYVDSVNIDSLEEALVPEFLRQLDPHSVYIPRSEVEHVTGELKSNFGGIGVTFSIRQDTICVMSVVAGGPSSALGVLPGDRIIAVNGHPFVGPGLSNQTVMDSLRGELGTRVKVRVLRNGHTELDFDIKRGVIPLTSVDVAYEIANGVGYIRIDRFAERTYEEMMSGVAKLMSAGCKKIIFDLRGNSGGFLNVVIAMCNEFLERGRLIVYTEGAYRARTNTKADGTGSCKDVELAVLIDEFSASASEIFAGAMQDNDRGIVIGRRSFGKGLVQREVALSDGSHLRLTVERYHTPSGRCIQRPYSNGTADYYDDVNVRFRSGELFSQDSIKADTSKIYHTRNGRVVYGGGGIIPDVFVPYDATLASPFLAKLRSRRLIYDYAISYVESHREALSAMTTHELVRHLLGVKFLSGMKNFAAKHGIEAPEAMDSVEATIIENEVRAYVGQIIKGSDAFYPILNINDPVIDKALEHFGVSPIYSVK